jgi:signal transduction histidine kinase
MHQLFGRVVWLLLVAIGILVATGIGGTLWLNAVSAEALHFSAISLVWLTFAVQLLLLATALFLATRFLKADRKGRAELARTEHLAEVALLAGGLAHEVRNHLHALQSRAGLLRKSLAGNEAALRRIEKLDEIADGMEQLLNNFLTFARPASDELECVNPAELIREVLDFEQLDLDRFGIRVELDLEDSLELFVDRGKLKRALLNIVVNATQAMPKGGRLRVECGRERGEVRIRVEDNGEGIPPDVLPRVFESYFTTKSQGSGLGLAIVRRTVEDFGGRVSCSSALGKGTTISIFLPAGGERPLKSDHRISQTAPLSESIRA